MLQEKTTNLELGIQINYPLKKEIKTISDKDSGKLLPTKCKKSFTREGKLYRSEIQIHVKKGIVLEGIKGGAGPSAQALEQL